MKKKLNTAKNPQTNPKSVCASLYVPRSLTRQFLRLRGLTPLQRSEMTTASDHNSTEEAANSSPQFYMVQGILDTQNQTCSSVINRPTHAHALSHTLTQRKDTLTMHKHLHTCTLSCAFFNLHKWTDRQTWSNSGTSPYMQFPVPSVPPPFSFKTLPLYSLRTKKTKKTLSLSAHAHSHRKQGTSSHWEIAV